MPEINPFPYDFMPQVDPSWNEEDKAMTILHSEGKLQAGDADGINIEDGSNAVTPE